MANPLVISCPPPRDIPDADLIDELAEHLFTGGQDVSDPDSCFRFLLELDVCRPMKLCDVADRVIDTAGKLYIQRMGQAA
jgi:hypothetical protein